MKSVIAPSKLEAPLTPKDTYMGRASKGKRAPHILREIAAEDNADAARVP